MKNFIIRKMTYSDFEPLYSLLSDPKVMKYLEPPFSKKQTKQFLYESGISNNPLIYAVEKDECFIGYVIYHDYDEHSMEIGWVLYPLFWNQGIASMLTAQLIEEIKHKGKHVIIECSPDQKSTIKIAQKFGFHNLGVNNGLLVFCL